MVQVGDLLCAILQLIQCNFVDMIVEWDGRKALEELRFTAVIMHKMSNNPRDFTIAQSLGYFDMGQAGREIEWYTALNARLHVLTSRGGFLHSLSFSPRNGIITTCTFDLISIL